MGNPNKTLCSRPTRCSNCNSNCGFLQLVTFHMANQRDKTDKFENCCVEPWRSPKDSGKGHSGHHNILMIDEYGTEFILTARRATTGDLLKAVESLPPQGLLWRYSLPPFLPDCPDVTNFTCWRLFPCSSFTQRSSQKATAKRPSGHQGCANRQWRMG